MGVKWPYKSLSLYVLISHESITYVSPDVFLCSYKSLIINTLQEIVRVSFSAGSFCEGLPGVLLLFATRNGETSRAGLYNDTFYGNVYRNSLQEFLKPQVSE
jgi:hypothetical protein